MVDTDALRSELMFKAVRSGGKGGQHVNKVSSKIELYFDINNSRVLSDSEKQVILKKLANRINKEGILILESQEERSQHRNKEGAIQKFNELITKALLKKKKRIKSKPSAASKAERMNVKKKHSDKKQQRQLKKWLE